MDPFSTHFSTLFDILVSNTRIEQRGRQRMANTGKPWKTVVLRGFLPKSVKPLSNPRAFVSFTRNVTLTPPLDCLVDRTDKCSRKPPSNPRDSVQKCLNFNENMTFQPLSQMSGLSVTF